MGASGVLASDLLSLKRDGRLDGATKVAEIGVQQLTACFLTSPLIDEIYQLFGCRRVDLGRSVSARDFASSAPPSRPFWVSLGLDYVAIDIAGDSLHLDLNRDAVPDNLRGTCDLVMNLGTTEHVANQDNAFRVIHDLTKPNGIMIHHVPSQGMMTHGLVSYTPKFFWHLCRENRYEVISLGAFHNEDTPIPIDVIDSNLRYANGYRLPMTMLSDLMICATLRKVDDRPFVTPMDVPL